MPVYVNQCQPNVVSNMPFVYRYISMIKAYGLLSRSNSKKCLLQKKIKENLIISDHLSQGSFS